MWVNKMSNQKTSQGFAISGMRQVALALGGLVVASATYAISQPAETFPNTARFEVTSVNTPVIVRGSSGIQTITIQNKGPNGATGTQALVRPATTTGVTIASVTWGASNTACNFSTPDYACTVGSVGNGGTFDIKVTYIVATTAVASTSVKQTEVRINSNEFNPGSGAGETLHKVWGALNQENPATEFGAFWAGRSSTVAANCNGRGTTCGTYAAENSAVLGAWPQNNENPIGEYLQTAVSGTGTNVGNDTYKVNGTKEPTYNRIVSDMSTYSLNAQKLATVARTGNSVNNRRAWEFRTYAYIPPGKTTAKLCVGADSIWVDDNAYITLTPANSVPTRQVVSTPRDAWNNNTYEVTTGGISGGGYYEIVYRIVNQNGDGSDEEAQGGYGKIGMAFDTDTCNVTNFDNAVEAGFPASITVTNPTADLSITKTNSVTSLTNSSSTNYIVRVTNNGPDSFTGAILKDAAATGLTKTAIACTGAAGNQCTAGTTPSIANIESAGGYALPTLANSAFYELSITASVSATATSVSNIATIAVPTGATDSNATNNSATDTDSIRARVRIAKISNNGVGTFNFTGLSNLSNAAGTAVTTDSVTTATSGVAVTSSQSNFSTNLNNAVLINETIPANYTLSSASCTDTNAAVSGNPATTFGSLSSNQLTIPAANIIAGADITCTFTNDLIRTDLAITKTGTSTVKAGQPVTYTLKVWNKGPTAVSDAIVTDIVPANLSGIGIQCTASGTATCGTFTSFIEGSNTRSATAVTLPVDATGNTNYATYTISGLAYSTGSFTNTATVNSATITELNNSDNSASQSTTITSDAPITTGNAANQCTAAQATNILTPTAFTLYNQDGGNASYTDTLPTTINNLGTSYGTGTNGAIIVNGKISWSYGNPIKTGSTLTIRVNNVDYAVLTTAGASINGSLNRGVGTATLTGLNGASVSPATINIDNTYSTYTNPTNFSVTLPTTVASVNSAQAVYLTLNPFSPTGATADDFRVSLDSVLQCQKPIVKIAKTSNGGTGTFAFNTLTNLSNSSGTAITTDSVTTATAGTAVTSSQTNYATALNTAVNITEAATANYVLNSLSCTDTNSGVTGNTGTFASLTTNTATINAAAIKYGANILCTFNNTKQRTLTLRKTWVNARLNDAATITATGLNSFASVADSANETDTAAAQAVNVGSTITLGENISTGVGLYNAALSCTRNNDSSAVTVTSNNLTMPDADVTCTYTNSRKSANLTLSKVWSNAKLNDAINITATGLTTFSSVANAANETDNAAAQTVYAGDNISFSETFTTGIASNYNAALACTGNTTALSGSNLTVNGADTDINCAYTNSRIAQQLNLSKTWQNGVIGHTATVTTTGSSNAASIISTAAGNNTTNGTAVSVYAGDTITLSSETFGGGATAAQYNSTLACAGGTTLTSGAVARSITISNSTTATVCTYNNSFIVPAKILVSGQVFEDNGASTGISNAYNGTQETGEVGIQGSQIALTNCSSTVVATTQTNANGEYTFSLLPSDLPAGNFCIAQKNLDGYSSVSGTAGYNRVTDQITVSNTGASSYPNHNFGDARLNVVLTEDGQQTIIAGGVADYPHRLTAQSVLTVTSLNQTNTQQPPVNSTDAPWQSLLYRDTDCNGKVDAGENLISASLPLILKANEQVCLVQRVYAPATASMGAQHIGQLQASFNVSLAHPTETITGSSIQRQDTTLLGSAGLSMQKMVRGVANCPSTAADTGAFATTNQAQSGGYLEYEITYRNNSLKNLVDISIKDTVPVGTVFQSNGCNVTPAGTCTASKTGDALLWQNTGILLPSQQGKVRFCVQIP